MRKIYFCFPFRGTGGVSVLFCRVAEHLSSAGLAKCYLIDYADGYMAMNRNPSRTELVEYPENGKVHIPGDASIIFQSMTPWSIFPNLDIHANTQVLFWNCHPLNLIPTLPGCRNITLRNTCLAKIVLNTALKNFTIKVRRFLLYLLDKNAIVFMDGTNLQVTCDILKVKVENPDFLPIPATIISQNDKDSKRIPDTSIIKFVWVGRIVDFKYFPLKRFLKDLSSIGVKSDIKFELTIVGGGEYIDTLAKEVLKIRYQTMSIKFIEHIDNKNLDGFIIENADILLGMGTSALEGAKLGIPTLLLDFSYMDISGTYKYRWVHQSTNFNLGEMVGMNKSNNLGNSLKEKITEFQASGSQISCREVEYFLAHHQLSAVSNKLLIFLDRADCKYGQLRLYGFLSRGILYSCFDTARQLFRRYARHY